MNPSDNIITLTFWPWLVNHSKSAARGCF